MGAEQTKERDGYTQGNVSVLFFVFVCILRCIPLTLEVGDGNDVTSKITQNNKSGNPIGLFTSD